MNQTTKSPAPVGAGDGAWVSCSAGELNNTRSNCFATATQDVRGGSQRELLLASMRAAASNLRTYQLEIELIGTALRNEQMSFETACEWLDDVGLLRWLPPPTEIEGEVAG